MYTFVQTEMIKKSVYHYPHTQSTNGVEGSGKGGGGERDNLLLKKCQACKQNGTSCREPNHHEAQKNHIKTHKIEKNAYFS